MKTYSWGPEKFQWRVSYKQLDLHLWKFFRTERLSWLSISYKKNNSKIISQIFYNTGFIKKKKKKRKIRNSVLSLLLKAVHPLNSWWCSYSGSCLLPSSPSSKAPVTKCGYQIPGLPYLSCWTAEDQRSCVWPGARGCRVSSSGSCFSPSTVSALQDGSRGCILQVCVITGNTFHPNRADSLPKPLPKTSTV